MMAYLYTISNSGLSLTASAASEFNGTPVTASFTEDTSNPGWYRADGSFVAGQFCAVKRGSVLHDGGLIVSIDGKLYVGTPSVMNAVVISPIVGEVAVRVFTFKHRAYLGEIAANTIKAISLATGAAVAQDLSGIASLSLTIVDAQGNVVQHVANADLDRSDDANGNITWTNNTAMTSTLRTLKAYLWNDSGPKVVMAGEVTIEYAKYGA